MSFVRSPNPTCASTSRARASALLRGCLLIRRGTATFSARVSVGIKLNAWNTKPTLVARNRVVPAGPRR